VSRVDERLGVLSALAGRAAPGQFPDHLEAVLNRALPNLTGDVAYDVVCITRDVFQTHAASIYQFSAMAVSGEQRLWALVVPDALRRIELHLVATHGSISAEPSLFGVSGPEIGNRPLVTVAFDALILSAVATGMAGLQNTPVDERVRDLYRAMGFTDGERLDLGDPNAVAAAMHYVDAQYWELSQRFRHFRRPW
jgi:hypothetical protein